MATLSTTKNYSDTTLLLADDLNVFLDEIEFFINTTKINDDNLIAGGLTGSTALKSASLSAAKINAAAITTAKLASNAATTAKILDANVTTAKLATNAVTTAKISSAQVTRAKLAALNRQTSAAGGVTVVHTNQVISVVSSLNLTSSNVITTTGRPVLVLVTTNNLGDVSKISTNTASGFASGDRSRVRIEIYRVNTSIGGLGNLVFKTAFSNKDSRGGVHSTFWALPSICFFDQPAAATYEYHVWAGIVDADMASVEFSNATITAYEVS